MIGSAGRVAPESDVRFRGVKRTLRGQAPMSALAQSGSSRSLIEEAYFAGAKL